MTLAYAPDRRAPAAAPAHFRKSPPPPLPGNSFVRFLTAHAKASIDRTRAPAEIAAERWPQDRAVELLLRAVSAPAQTNVAGWAEELTQKIVVDFLEALYPASAAAALFAQGLSLTWGREASISLPGFSVGFGGSTSAFVAERQPIPVFERALSIGLLLPHKVAGIFVLTREMIESSNAEKFIVDVATRSIGRVLDEVLFDANPGDASRPAGLRAGVAASAAEATLTGQEAFLADVTTLANVVGPIASNAPIAFITSPGRALNMRMRMPHDLDNVLVLGSNAVINDFLCVATAALVSAVGSEPEVESSKVASLHMESAPPPDPTTPGAPQRALWQTDSIGIKVRWPLTWALRDIRGFAWMTPAGW